MSVFDPQHPYAARDEQALLAELFTVDRKTITIAVQETRALLDQHGYVVAPSTARFHLPADLLAFIKS